MKAISQRARGEDLEFRLSQFVVKCHSNGLAVTPQRLAVMRAVLSVPWHPRADQVYSNVRRMCPYISLATVHRTLETLCRIGELRKVTPLHLSARYDANLHPHHHLVCVDCRRVEDIVIPELEKVLLPLAMSDGFKALGFSTEIRGLCKRCDERRQRRSATSPSGGAVGHP
ncbi:MAG: Fur family transcriptional regulator [Candidatus Binataceae bacterium]